VNYDDYEDLFSKPRLDKYKCACNEDEQKALELYMLNIEMSKTFFGVLSLFEIVLRNAIDKHYKRYFSDDDWISNQADNGFFPEHKKTSVYREREKETYSPDSMVSALSLGFWTEMFSSHCFKKGNQTLLKIFPNKQKGVNQKLIFNELKEIRDFRNRIAHHESICFNKQGKISTKYVQYIWGLILKYIGFFGISDIFLQNVELPISDIRKLNKFKEIRLTTLLAK